MILKGLGVIVTGGSTGIGKTVAHSCLLAGADVLICARNSDLLNTAKAELAGAGPGRLLTEEVDVSNAADVERLIGSACKHLGNFGAVVNAAGVLGPIGELDEIAVEDWIRVLKINLIGTMLVSRSVLPHFRKRGSGKILTFSGGGGTNPRPRFSAYAASKAAVVRFSENLAQELSGTNIFVNAVAPGAVNTRMLDETIAAGSEKTGEAAFKDALKQKSDGGASAARAAALCVKLLSPEADGLTGKLLSAVWDPWESVADWKDQAMQNDVYTLRRIVPSDRGLKF